MTTAGTEASAVDIEPASDDVPELRSDTVTARVGLATAAGTRPDRAPIRGTIKPSLTRPETSHPGAAGRPGQHGIHVLAGASEVGVPAILPTQRPTAGTVCGCDGSQCCMTSPKVSASAVG